MRPNSIISIDTSITEDSGQIPIAGTLKNSYVYLFADLEKENARNAGKEVVGAIWYLGYHCLDSKKNEKFLDGHYWHSSTDTTFRNQFYSSKPKFTLKIIATGSKIDMMNLESKLESEKQVTSNPDYYNKAVAPTGFPTKTIQDLDKCDRIVEILDNERTASIEDKKWSKTVKGSYITNVSRLQPREKTDPVHVKRVKENIENANNLDNIQVVIFEGLSEILRGYDGPDDADVAVDGSHTACAMDRIEWTKDADAVITFIPKTVWLGEWNLTESEARHLGNRYNPRSKVTKKEIGDTDVVKEIVFNASMGIEIDSDHSRRVCSSHGFTHHGTVKSIIQAAKEKYNDEQTGTQVLMYGKEGTKENNERLKEVKNKYDVPHQLVVTGGAGSSKNLLWKITRELTSEDKNGKTQAEYCHKVVLVTFFNKDRVKDGWSSSINNKTGNVKTGERHDLEQLVNKMLFLMGPCTYTDENNQRVERKRTFEICEMPHRGSDITIKTESAE